jgi:hypothetical protein
MNEQIKKLMNQSMESTGVEGLVSSYMELNPEKFAELIKQAIYDKVKEELIPDDIIAEEQAHHQEYLKGCNAGTVDALCHIKNFGVDE